MGAQGHAGTAGLARRNTLFRVAVLALLVGLYVAFRALKALIWSGGNQPADGWFDVGVQWGAVAWALMVPWAVADVLGWMIFRRHTPVSAEAESRAPGETMSHQVVFRIVTRGDQPATAIATTWSVLETMQRRPLFPFAVEVVSDLEVEGLPEHPAVRAIVVPSGYRTSNGATHKARALHYALGSSPAPDDAWILHLDEESHVTDALIGGIRAAVTEEERTGAHRIGQGLITYHRELNANPLYTLADSIRVGDDMGRFHLQYRLQRILFGMHGSFLLVRGSVEKQIGFDFTPEGCTTEDTTWALHQMAAGNRFRWVDGTVVEQSPANLKDFLAQRRRWFTGMWWGARHAPVPVRHRAPLFLAMFLWSISWVGFAYAFLHVFSGVGVPWPLGVVGDMVFAVYLANYLLGLWVSLAGDRSRSVPRKARYLVDQAILLPVFAVLEGAAVIYALLRPERRFHVVDKPIMEPRTAHSGAA
ncbi:MAG: glycosyltransferase family 2 protein [Actinomycetota bacterium]